ncbi:MAG: histone deacetylase family protein [Alphaproteobacteria bacterium]|nr:histone deacetylase family protein [Alphaproteobacteria bacterium]
MDIIYSEDHRKRASKTELYGGELLPPFECPERMDFILEAIEKTSLGTIHSPKDFGRDPITAIHEEGFVTFIETCWQEWVAAGFKGEAIASVWPSRSMPSPRIPSFIDGKMGYYTLASETSISAGTAEAAYTSAQVALTAADAIMKGQAQMMFALCRPPGHHASKDQFGGYCFYNNAAIAAQHMRDQGAAKVAILDVDFHHGNGTQAIFYDRDDVLFLSLHGDPAEAFPYFLGYAEETGLGAGEGYNVNYPMPPKTPYSKWSEALDDALGRIRAFGADSLIVSFGADTFENDPISFFKLTSADFIDMGRRIATLNLPTLTVMEGGYAVSEVGTNTVNLLLGMEGQ